ncbi:MAG: transglutaminase domain-containing protein [Epsilonproteobacteria bacterium]|nr:transglutaminase domain-containing protein [Campylobacterota bacterium]
MTSKNISLFILMIAFIAFVYGTSKAIQIVDKTQVGTSDGIYTSYISTSEEIKQKAFNLTKNCVDNVCKVQTLLDFTSNIPYQTNTFQQNSPQKTIQKNYGDCDDKSNLLISMLHAIGIKAYFVLLPKHIFVIVPLNDNRLSHIKGLWVRGTKYYILESTAKGSVIGFPLKYKLDEIDAIIEPFSNKKLDIRYLKYKL